MSSQEFIEGLRVALSGMNGDVVQQHLEYYSNYIIEQIKLGKSEEQVISELGEPWLIAKNLKDNLENEEAERSNTTYVEFEDGYKTETDSSQYGNNRRSQIGCWITILIIGIILYAALYILSGIVKIISPILVPLLVVTVVVGFLKNRK